MVHIIQTDEYPVDRFREPGARPRSRPAGAHDLARPPTSATGGRRASTIPRCRRVRSTRRLPRTSRSCSSARPAPTRSSRPVSAFAAIAARRPVPSSSRPGRVTSRYEKRGREYVDVHTDITTADAPGPGAVVFRRFVHTGRDARRAGMKRTRTLAITDDAIRAVLPPRELPLGPVHRGRARPARSRRARNAGCRRGLRRAARRVG